MLPERFGRYEVLAEIGDGAMGRVFEPARKNGIKVKVRWTVRQTYRRARR